MIQLKKITTANVEEYNYLEELMHTSFPEIERRDREAQRDYTDNNPFLQSYIALDESKPVGFVNIWKLNGFYYIEHIAIDPSQRNGGYGKRVLEKIESEFNEWPIVLEVEKPEDEMSSRRINFYKRLGFVLHELPYIQPPYRVDGKELPLYLMSYGKLNMEEEYHKIRSSIYKEVYNKIEPNI
ncbi:MAG: GNAT family N-acetyltransferase [Phocaeicola sp.]